MIAIRVNPKLKQKPALALLRRAAETTLRQQGMVGDLTIALETDTRLRALNRAYRGVDASTDVLSFAAGEADPRSGVPYLGDVIISVPRAARQARAAGHATGAELQLLVVHGVLHLLGHDHARPAQKKRMWSAQAEILSALGLADIRITE